MKYIIDGHYDILMDVAARRKKGERQVIRRRYYPAFQKGGVTGIVASIFVDSQYLPYGALSIAMEQISALHCEIEETPDLLMLCTSADDFLRAAETGRIGFLLSFEGAEPVSSCLLLHGFYAAGVRGLGLAWSRRNAAADGCDFSGSLKKGGLTEFGRELVKEAEDLHMILDLSHLSDEGVEDVLSITSCPVIASHSNSRAVAGSNRNLTDCQMREIASRGGTVGLNGCSLLTAGPGVSPDQNGLTAHLDHMTEIMGEDHVAFGFDFCDSFFADDLSSSTDQMPERPFDILSGAHEDLPAFLDHLRQHGYTESHLAKLAGENWLHTFRHILKH